MPKCEWLLDEVCTNPECPVCVDFCPVTEYPGVCRFEELEEAPKNGADGGKK